MDILVLYDYGHVNGGAAKVAIAGAIGLAERGHRVVYLTPVGPMDARLAASGVETVLLDQPDLISDPSPATAAVRGVWNWGAAKAVKAAAADLDPKNAVILQHGWSKALSPASERAIAESGLPTLYYMHEYFAACPNGAFFDYRAGENCDRVPLSTACVFRNCDARAYGHKLFRVMRHAALLGPGRFKENLHHLIYISELQRRVMSPWLPADAKMTFAPNPIEVDDLGPALIDDEAPFLFVGRFSREKGALLAAEAARQAEAPMVFVGDGEQLEAVKAAAPNARFTGWIKPEDTLREIRGARALVFPSLWYECQPLTVLEALANGVPVIVSDNCAGAEFVADGRTGLHFKSQNVSALSDAMRRMKDDGDVREMGAAAHTDYWANPHTMERHLDVLEEALRRTQAGE